MSRLEDVPAALRDLQLASRRAIPMALLGLVATVLAGAVAIFYIFNLSQDLHRAQAELISTREALESARRELTAAREALTTAGSSTQSPERVAIESVLVALLKGERNLATASQSLDQVAGKLPPPAAPSERWFAVLASYNASDAGLKRALQHVDRLQAAGHCAEVWRTTIRNNYAVVLGGPTHEASARDRAGQARSNGMAPDAYARRDRDWAFVRRPAGCAGSSGVRPRPSAERDA